MAHRFLLVTSPLALLGSLLVTSQAWASTQECEADEDCGAGFVCQVTQASSGGNTGGAGGTAGAGSGTGGGGGAASFCGDGMCMLTETSESCSADCVEVRYCAPAECDDTSDCAEGYFCAAEMPPGTGGSGPSWCGDGICTTGEDEANCAADCATRSVCTVEWNGCTSDMDCPDGFYCDLPSSGSGSGGISGAGGDTGAGGFMVGGSSGTAGTVGSGGAGGAEGGTGGSAGGMSERGQAGTGSGFAAPRPEGGSGGLSDPLPGACLPTGGGSGGAPGTGGVSTGGSGAVSAGGSAGGWGADGGTDSGGTAGTGTTGSGANGSGATGGTSSNSGGAAGSTSSSGGMAGSGGPKDGDLGGGCSYSASSSSSPFGLIAGLALLFARGRRRSARRA